eukprot:jgi/Tetstr1/466204/TSEL_010762.t1
MSFIAPQGAQAGLALLLSPASGAVVLRSACAAVGTLYPVFESLKAVESGEGHVQWLTYWSVYGSLGLVEGACDGLLGWCPYYYHAKLAFLLWLILPRYYGAAQLYTTYGRPLFLRYRDRVDGVLQAVRGHVEAYLDAHETELRAAKDLWHKAVDYLRTVCTGK